MIFKQKCMKNYQEHVVFFPPIYQLSIECLYIYKIIYLCMHVVLYINAHIVKAHFSLKFEF